VTLRGIVIGELGLWATGISMTYVYEDVLDGNAEDVFVPRATFRTGESDARTVINWYSPTALNLMSPWAVIVYEYIVPVLLCVKLFRFRWIAWSVGVSELVANDVVPKFVPSVNSDP
jgi:hypothetical protein